MSSFQVLDRQQPIHQNYLLEASAGTGKTFSIENIVVRLLFEEEPIHLEEILVVTFTRAATRDLKVRIRKNIERCSGYCEQYLQHHTTKNVPDYLLKVFEEGEEATILAKRRLERALFAFDQAQIFTIHSFCARMLCENVFEGNLRIDAISIEEPFPYTELLAMVHDFFRTKMSTERYGVGEVKLLLNEFQGDLNRLEKELLSSVLKGGTIELPPTFKERFHQFQKACRQLKEKGVVPNIAEVELLARGYKGICDRSGQVKPEIYQSMERFLDVITSETIVEKDYDWMLEDQLTFCPLFVVDNKKSRAKIDESVDESWRQLLSDVQNTLRDLIHPAPIFLRMVYDCQKLLREHMEREEKFGFDDILKAMRKALQNSEFRDKVQARFQAAIIDEFQDTDPLQWEIFQALFIENDKTYLYLVGDPKQSIYAFRQADIYTYLSAAEALGEGALATLETNYRSQPSLVSALNALFSSENAPGLLDLPKMDDTLDYPMVKSSPFAEEKEFTDDLGAVHFFVAKDDEMKTFRLSTLERESLFPYIINELLRLHKAEGIQWNQFAILVSDRFQADRLQEALSLYNIPSMTQRSGNLAESPAVQALKELIVATLNPRNDSALKTALGGKIIGWTHEDIITLNDMSVMESTLVKFYDYKNILEDHGVATFIKRVMESIWSSSGRTVTESLLSQEGGDEFLDEFKQVTEVLYEYERTYRPTHERLVAFLDHFEALAENDDDRVKKLSDPTRKAVSIMTLHASKGLEFDIVFTLGLVKRGKGAEMMIPGIKGGQKVFVPATDQYSDEQEAYSSEINAEKIRQLYVAMTRAKYRLYNPIIVGGNLSDADQSDMSPMELFLQRFKIDFETFIDGTSESMTLSVCKKEVTESIVDDDVTIPLVKPAEVKISDKRIDLLSFTTLSTPKHVEKKVQPPHDFHEVVQTPHTLPSGSEIGTLLHNCLEHVDFSLGKDLMESSELEEFLYPLVKGSRYENWISVICDVVANTLKVELQEGLHVYDIQEFYREAEFLYPYHKIGSEGYMKGFIDLMFVYEGKYYLLDWKSNWLGPTYQDYHRDNLAQAMDEHDYTLQAELYTQALKKYLALFSDKPFETLFGGVFYVFLRGVDPVNGGGVYAL